jgi:putative flippase GtrA
VVFTFRERLPLIASGARYIAAGLLSFCANIMFTVLFVEFMAIRIWIASAISFSIVLLINFFIARSFVFRAIEGRVMLQAVRYLLLNATMRAAEYALFLMFLGIFASHYTFCLVLALSTSNIFKFLAYRFLVFGTVPDYAIGRDGGLQETSERTVI